MTQDHAHPWDYESLWAKARLYVERASEQERDGSLYPFWSILALELLARATLASVHPALLADPREPSNMMFAFGYAQPRAPRSVAAKTVFLRCAQVVQEFTDDDVRSATALIEMRNEELHSGGTPFEGLGTSSWLIDHYRLCRILLTYLDKDLFELFGEEEARAAERIIEVQEKEILGEVKGTIASARKIWRALSGDERKQRRQSARMVLVATEGRALHSPNQAGKRIECPACKTAGWTTGEVVKTGRPRAGEDEILQTFTKLPTRFVCFACRLDLNGEAAMAAADLGNLFDIEIGEDPASFYGIATADSVTAEDFFDDAYGND